MKAIAILDKMPKDCDECPLVSSINDMCILLDEDAFPNAWVEDAPYYSLKEKGDCPLRPLPKRIPPNEYGNMTPYGSVWNGCIDEILGGE